MGILHQLIYFSTARPGLEFKDLRNIMSSAEENNFNQGVTGLLCYGDSKFLQVLEGDRDALSQIFCRIISDERHSQVTLIKFSTAERRMFPDWSMKLVRIHEFPIENIRQLYQKYCDTESFSPDTMDGSKSTEFMRELRENYAIA